MKTWVLYSELSCVKASGSRFSRLYPSFQSLKVKFQCFLKLQKQKQNEKSKPSKRTKHQRKSKIISICLKKSCPHNKQASLAEQICIINVFENLNGKHLNFFHFFEEFKSFFAFCGQTIHFIGKCCLTKCVSLEKLNVLVYFLIKIRFFLLFFLTFGPFFWHSFVPLVRSRRISFLNDLRGAWELRVLLDFFMECNSFILEIVSWLEILLLKV